MRNVPPDTREDAVQPGEILEIDALNEQKIVTRRRFEHADDIVSPWSYRAKVGRGTIRLSTVEFRILSFLAAHPYRAYSPHHIASAVSTDSHPVTAGTLPQHIAALRSQLGFYGDLIQSVPFIGYRFKK